MARKISAQLGLLAFSAAIVAGLQAGNSATSIILRALLAMVIATLIGQFLGWAVKVLLRDRLQRIKLEIDREHFEAVQALLGQTADEEAADAPDANDKPPPSSARAPAASRTS